MKAFLSRLSLRAGRWWRRRQADLRMRRVTSAPSLPTGPVLFAVVRNEMLRLPRFLAHYRELGFGEFIFVANNCTDGTDRWLAEQAGVTLYVTTETFLRKEAWIDLLLRRHGRGRWCLVVDADELLDFPDSSTRKIDGLCAYLQSRDETALHAVLLDLYPDAPLGSLDYRAGGDYFAREWYFDPLDTLEKAPRAFAAGLDHRLEGGSRWRLFGVKSCCSKFPLFRFEPGVFLTDGQHYLEGAHISQMRAVLYHLKYLQDFAPHVREEVERGQHWRGASEYKVYASRLEDLENRSFRDERSIRLEGVDQLEKLGFIIRPNDFVSSPS